MFLLPVIRGFLGENKKMGFRVFLEKNELGPVGKGPRAPGNEGDVATTGDRWSRVLTAFLR